MMLVSISVLTNTMLSHTHVPVWASEDAVSIALIPGADRGGIRTWRYIQHERHARVLQLSFKCLCMTNVAAVVGPVCVTAGLKTRWTRGWDAGRGPRGCRSREGKREEGDGGERLL